MLQQKTSLNVKGRLIDLSVPQVMGILNITPDSFFDGGQHNALDAALKRTSEMLEEGAEMIDIGAYSSRPGAADISLQEETDRLLPVLQTLIREFPDLVISIDTFRSEVARMAVAEGAHIINDISGGELDAEMFRTVAELRVPYILMHMKGTPQTMQQQARYGNVVNEVLDYFAEKTGQLTGLGVKDIILDPGFGFAKTTEHNFHLLDKLETFKILDFPLLAGMSRKGMIWKTLEITPHEALNGTTVVNTIALMKGARILRVHDVKAAVEAVKIVSRLNRQ
ncbi:MAG TPA: dihydropteroate synthase [Sphingobacteriaceae bacterium]